MKKILIIGSSGAGKSTFARRLCDSTGIELIHLDKVFWRPNWVETQKDEWRETVENLLKKESWIMDGNYSGTIEMRIAACDTVVFLDLPRTTCVRRVIKRSLFYKGSNRPDMAEGCPEKLDLEFLKFLKWIWDYPTRSKPKVEALLKQYQGTKNIFRLTTTKEIENFFVNLSPVKVKSI
jgi:adenylate kinase family enzyme